ncbi:hypothetical protein ONV75_15700 [Clostridium sp. LQ25]|uniref:hypothetical protein n=1 Tax=Clostridium TaxID=1485 RepID=UPI000F532AD5|nr:MULTISPECIES: hypothetical protein [Clostridium]RQN10624.1 hypothetical protein EHW71_09835 [Clostridium butyricum]UZT06027.1 hypothetical protein ONV75_15700 [Clostridium sp. LQ25]
MNKVTKKNIIFVSIVLILFFIYSTIGFHYEQLVFTMNRFLGADNQRAIEDMVVYSANHYRTSVHTLF